MTITNIIIVIVIFIGIFLFYAKKKNDKNRSLMNDFDVKIYWGASSEYAIAQINNRPYFIEIINDKCIHTEIKSLTSETRKRISASSRNTIQNESDYILNIVLANERVVIKDVGLKYLMNKIENSYLEILSNKLS